MKTLHFGIIIAVAITVTAGVVAVTFLTLQNNIEKQNQEEKIQARVHVTSNFTSHEDYNPFKYVKINDLIPNSAVMFSYPYTGNQTFDAQSSHKWTLIRLSSGSGGDKDDISSFRAYSMIDIHIGCNVIYKPQYAKLIDGCHDDTYEPVNGTWIGGNVRDYNYAHNALPNLDLGVDDDGYIYVKNPTFEFDKNGVIGAGRTIQ